MKNRSITCAAILLALGSFALSIARAVTPAPDGGYPGANTAEGQNALLSLSTGRYNTAAGFSALQSNRTGSYNTGVGAGTLFANTGGQNTATGAGALLHNTSGEFNTANGAFALNSNTTGDGNTAVGNSALPGNTIGDNNTADGAFALFGNTTGANNTAVGAYALQPNSTGADNTAVGSGALLSSSSSSGNTAVGSLALSGSPGDDNIALGVGAGHDTDGSFNILIGHPGVSGESHAIRIGTLFGQTDAYISGVYTAQATSRQVYADADGHLGTLSSSRRYKESIEAMDRDSEALFAVKPVTFHYKKDPAGIRSFGLIAEEVAQVSPDLITRDEHGQPQTVRYEAVNAMLLNEFLKEHRKVEEQESTILELKSIVAKQEKGMDDIAAHIRDQDAKIQSVSVQIKMGKRAPKVVINKPQTGTAD